MLVFKVAEERTLRFFVSEKLSAEPDVFHLLSKLHRHLSFKLDYHEKLWFSAMALKESHINKTSIRKQVT